MLENCFYTHSQQSWKMCKSVSHYLMLLYIQSLLKCEQIKERKGVLTELLKSEPIKIFDDTKGTITTTLRSFIKRLNWQLCGEFF